MTMQINGTSGLVFNDASTQNTAATGFGFKNRIINGNFAINQRGFSGNITTLGGGQYTLDRWFGQASQSDKFSVSQNAGSVTPPVGFSNYLGITSTSAYSITSGDYFSIKQSIEGFNTSDLGWGTANASTVTLSFRVYSSLTGTFGGVLQNAAFNRSYPFTYTISSANTWTTVSVTVAGDTTGTWVGATNGAGLVVIFGLGVGSSFSGTAGSWAGGNLISATGATSVVGTNGATFYITGVQLEKGSTATSFDYRPYGTELALCQRYCYLIGRGQASSAQPMGVGYYLDGGTVSSVVSFPITMRAAPTLSATSGTNFYTCYRNGGSDSFDSLSLDISSPNYIGMFNNAQASGTAGQAGIFFITSNATSAVVVVSAEL